VYFADQHALTGAEVLRLKLVHLFDSSGIKIEESLVE
jgi:hypothetical protein